MSNGWVAISGLNLAVTQNSYYWLGFNLQSANTVRLQGGQAANTHYYASSTYGALPSTYPTSRDTNDDWFVMRATVMP